MKNSSDAQLAMQVALRARIKSAAWHVGYLGVTLDQIAHAVRDAANLPETENVNVMFGPVTSAERALFVPFTAEHRGGSATGRVLFQVLESNARQWGGSAILLDGQVVVD